MTKQQVCLKEGDLLEYKGNFYLIMEDTEHFSIERSKHPLPKFGQLCKVYHVTKNTVTKINLYIVADRFKDIKIYR